MSSDQRPQTHEGVGGRCCDKWVQYQCDNDKTVLDLGKFFIGMEEITGETKSPNQPQQNFQSVLSQR